jgi:protein-tyrosine phosphatase
MAEMELMRLGHSATTFRSHEIDSYLVDSADLILTATRNHRSEVLAMNPGALRRTFTLMEFAALTELVEGVEPRALVAQAARQRSLAPAAIDIGDPYRRSPEIHRATADQIDAAVHTISARLNALVTIPRSVPECRGDVLPGRVDVATPPSIAAPDRR